jgi:hypothetical protein
MRWRLLAIVVLSMIAVACGDGTSSQVDDDTGSNTTTAADAPTSTAPPTSSASTTGSSEEPSSTTTTVLDDRPIAPDFSLALGSGGTFVLSEESRPVYLVFWAEW